MMIINLMCGECMEDAMKNTALYMNEFSVPISEIRDDLIYDVVCSKGHKTKCLLMNQKFELLFEIGLNDFADRSFRGAVSSFAAALERFGEFFVKILLRENPHLDRIWKQVQNQSERQLGAYMFLYLCKVGSPPPTLGDEMVAFRNRVIHKGYVPTSDETLAFGEAVRALINEGLGALKRADNVELVKVLDQFYENAAEQGGVRFACNILPAVDAKFGPDFGEDDIRRGTLSSMIPHILRNREPQRLRLFKTEEEREKAEKNVD